MDPLQKQVADLSTKVDALYQIVEQLSLRVTEALPDTRLTAGRSVHTGAGTNYYQYQRQNRLLDSSMEHKDVITDDKGLDITYQRGEKLAPEIQIQRLTAQLTAAYNRIAALEERLLAQRTH